MEQKGIICDEYRYPISVQDIELELLGMTLLKGGDCIPKIAEILTPADFDRQDFSVLFNTILTLHAESTTVTMLSITEHLESHRQIDRVGYSLIMDLGQAAFTDAYAEGYSRTIRKYSLQRQAVTTLQKAQDTVQKGGDNAVFDACRAVLNFFDAESATITKTPPPMRLSDYFAGGENSPFQKMCHENQKFKNRKSGFYNFDENQIFAPGLYVIGAPPAAGKTTFCWQLLNQFAERGERCVFVSAEMSMHEMLTKSLARRHFSDCRRLNLPTIPSNVIKTGAVQNWLEESLDIATNAGLDDSEISNLPHVKSADLLYRLMDSDIFRELDFSIIDCPNTDIDSVLMNLRGYVSDTPAIVAIDYLQILRLSDENDKTSETDRLQKIMSKLKNFSRRYNVLVIVISAFNRDSYGVSDALKSFRGSSAVEYTADVVFTLSLNPASELDENGRKIPVDNLRELQKRQPRPIKLSCLKNRSGNIFDCYFEYYSANDCFIPVDDPDRIDAGEQKISAGNVDIDTSNADYCFDD